ncbi:MAG: AMP-binding protein [Paludibacteraceae bacterium]|nr:AMP-binding protein [Paludibacteraceae bacterium]MBR6493375.1 AMP-binding protein [Paludibacteraceae bacterium]
MTEEKYNFVKIFERSFREHWDLEAVTDYGTDVTLTYGQLAINIEKLHILFKECGIKKNDKIAVMGKNNSNWVAVYLATVTYGAIIVPILQDFRANDAIHIINHSEAKLLFISDINWEGIDLDQIPNVLAAVSLNDWHPISLALDPKKINFEAIASRFKEKHPDGYWAEDVHFDERANSEVGSINYTSGTTGFSKGVVMPLNGLAGNIRYALEENLVGLGARHVAFLPLAHAYGCAFDFLSCLAAGGHTWLVGRTPSPKILLKAFSEIKPTIILSVPLILEKIYKKMIVPQIQKPPVSWVLKVPFLDEVVCSKIREQLIQAFGGEFSQMIIGGAPLNPEVEAFLTRIKFPMSVGYGMTECAPLITFTPYSQGAKLYSCGKPLKGIMEVKIVDPNEEGIGEVVVRGENTMKGYYKNPQATRESFTKDGWLRTGDLGLLDEDGFLYIKGRCKTMLLGPSGQNIYPEEIEAKINNMPYVLESLVLQQEDNRLVALICPDYNEVDASGMTNEQFDEFIEDARKQVNSELASYEQIAIVKIYPHEFEKTPKKSIKRFLYTSMV